MSLHYDIVDSPIGGVLVVVSERGVRMTRYPFTGVPEFERSPEKTADVRRQLDLYFRRRLTKFDLPLDWVGTPFQDAVWKALCGIPYGEVRSYRDIVDRAGGCARAVGQANHRNPIGILVPCHRVIAADGSLGGYAAGLVVKRRLLELEGYSPR